MKNGTLLAPGIVVFGLGMVSFFCSLNRILPQWVAWLMCIPLVFGAWVWVVRELDCQKSLPLFSCLIPLIVMLAVLVDIQTQEIQYHQNLAANAALFEKIRDDLHTRRARLQEFTREIQNSNLNYAEKASFLRDLRKKDQEFVQSEMVSIKSEAERVPHKPTFWAKFWR